MFLKNFAYQNSYGYFNMCFHEEKKKGKNQQHYF